MMSQRLKSISVQPSVTIRSAMDVISNAVMVGAPTGIVLVVDDDERLLGIMTDGDVRRGLLRGASLDDTVESIMVRDPVTLSSSLTPTELVEKIKDEAGKRKRLRESKVDKLILLGDDGRVDDIVSFYDLWYLSQANTRTVAVVGLGFVGLTLAVTLADAGINVIGVESNEQTVQTLRSGRAHFHEVGLESLLRYHMERSQLTVTQNVESADADVFIIAVGTPVDANGEPDLTDVKAAAHAVGKRLVRRGLVILRSTVPVGTCRSVVAPILESESGMKLGRDIFLAFAPERTVEGKALEELRSLPQVVGGWDRASVQMTANLMRELTPTIVEVESLEAAEMIKLVNNSFRDLSFAFANELALICDHWNIDATQLVRSANEGYPRNRVPAPSPGVGGICLTKDPIIYSAVARSAGVSNALPGIGRNVNKRMPRYVADRILQFLHENSIEPSNAKVLLAGFAFKGQPETSDTRFSAAIDVLRYLREAGINVWGYDPVVGGADIDALGVRSCTIEQGFKDAHAVAILNNHPVFTKLDLYPLLESMARPALVFDGWRVYPPDAITRVAGISYASLGMIRPSTAARDSDEE
jgi:nucleotide sugar dehydrogenase